MKIFRLGAVVLAITAAWVIQPVFGDGTGFHDFIFTENSSKSLSITFDGSPLTVTPLGSDVWLFSLPTGFSETTPVQQWTEPENSNLVNLVSFQFDPLHDVFPRVISDFPSSSQFPINADGASVLVGTDGGVDVFATFHDNAAAAEAPDTGTTGSFLGLSLMGLAFLRRLRHPDVGH